MLVKEIVKAFDEIAPYKIQESYDNSGLIIGNPDAEVNGVLLTIDTTEEVVDEAINKNINLIVSHHPIIFNGLKQIIGKDYVEKTIIKAIKNDIAILSVHTNLDSIIGGVNSKIADKLELIQQQILNPVTNHLCKLVVFVPESHANEVREAIFAAGGGVIGNYDKCSYNLKGTGTFRGLEGTNPYIGQAGKINFEDELRIETVFPNYMQSQIVRAMQTAHPYEEVAFDVYPLQNKYPKVGQGLAGKLLKPIDEIEFLGVLKQIFGASCIRYTKLLNKKIRTVAICGGSGSFLIKSAISSNSDILITSDVKYHQFFDAEDKIIIADIGHYESEQYTKEVFFDLLMKKFPNFVTHFSEIKTNPINYF